VAHRVIREVIPHREADYYFQEDLLPALALVSERGFLRALPELR
jgi:hypothetical protein